MVMTLGRRLFRQGPVMIRFAPTPSIGSSNPAGTHVIGRATLPADDVAATIDSVSVSPRGKRQENLKSVAGPVSRQQGPSGTSSTSREGSMRRGGWTRFRPPPSRVSTRSSAWRITLRNYAAQWKPDTGSSSLPRPRLRPCRRLLTILMSSDRTHHQPSKSGAVAGRRIHRIFPSER